MITLTTNDILVDDQKRIVLIIRHSKVDITGNGAEVYIPDGGQPYSPHRFINAILKNKTPGQKIFPLSEST